jgi:hypothetical protein
MVAFLGGLSRRAPVASERDGMWIAQINQRKEE